MGSSSKVFRNMSKTHPTYEIMVCKAIADLKQRNGSSRIAIKKYIDANYDVTNLDVQFRIQIKKLLAKGVVFQPKPGANSSFKITPEQKAKLLAATKKKAAAEKKAA